MAAGFNADCGFIDKFGRDVVAERRAMGKAREHINRRNRLRRQSQSRQMPLQLLQYALKQGFFQRERALLRRKRLVFKGLEFRRNETLGVFHGLAATVIVGHLIQIRIGDFDKEASHSVVLNAQIGNAGALALARFHFDQELAAVVLNTTQLIQIRREAVSDYPAFAQYHGRFGQDGGGEQRMNRLIWLQRSAHRN